MYRSDPESRAGFFLAPGWQITAHSVSIGYPSTSSTAEPPKASNYSLEGYTAAFSTVYPIIALPDEIAEKVHEMVGSDGGGLVDCDTRDSKPSLIINLALGSGYFSFVLDPYDYIRETPKFEFFPRKRKCQVNVGVLLEQTSDAKYIILGNVFLARFYTVFDYNNETISCRLHLLK